MRQEFWGRREQPTNHSTSQPNNLVDSTGPDSNLHLKRTGLAKAQDE